jgi:hypothetical protein
MVENGDDVDSLELVPPSPGASTSSSVDDGGGTGGVTGVGAAD